MEKTAIAAGHLCLDVLPEMTHIGADQFAAVFKPGHLISVGQAVFSTGGPVSNVGLALHKLGIPTRLIAKTGRDYYGQIIQQIISEINPNLLAGVSQDDTHPTSYSVIISPTGVDRIFLHCPGVNDAFSAADIDYSLVEKADLFHFGYPPVMQQMYENEGEALQLVFRNAKQTGVTTSLDMTFPDPASPGGKADWRKILQKTLPFVDIFTPSVEEILFMLERKTYDKLVAEHGDLLNGLTPKLLKNLGSDLLNMGAKMILLKLGHKGAYLKTTNQNGLKSFGRAMHSNRESWASISLWSACYKVDVVGTTGSGDATIAGFLSAILRDYSPHQALNAAVAVGACNVEAPDALGGLRTWEDTQSRIKAYWQKHPLAIKEPGWDWNHETQLWEKFDTMESGEP